MPTETDMRLRSWLDANQRDREQMCRSVLALDRHYSDVRPRHPSGGPDGGRDIEAVFDGERIAYGAVGFQNGANDSGEQKKAIRAKFSSDLVAALTAKPDLKVFIFLTNLHLTMGEQSDMKEEARKAGIEHCDVFDRERLRIELDSSGGFFIRFQHLAIPLSEAEQASFLSRYGSRIQEVVSTGFQRVEQTLNRILFLQEAANVLDGIHVHFRLKRSYAAADIGHFRAFVWTHLRAPTHGIFAITFGSADKSDRFLAHSEGRTPNNPPGIGDGISHVAWEEGASGEGDKGPIIAGIGSSIGFDPVSSIIASYSHDDYLIRLRPRLQLRDLEDCLYTPVLNLKLADTLHSIQVFANGYKLADIGPEGFTIETLKGDFSPPNDAFSPEELRDPWVCIRPINGSSNFTLDFASVTPRRTFSHEEMQDSAASRRG